MAGTYVSIPGSHNFDITVYGKGTVISGSGNDKITITDKGKIVVGSGHDTLSLLKGGVISQLGSAGRDTIHIGSGTTTIFEQGRATVSGHHGSGSDQHHHSSGAFGSATIFGGELKVTESHGLTKDIAVSGKMTLLGSAAPTEFVGGSGSTSMVGGKGNDTFIGGTGHETMVGGKGHDLFEFLSVDKGGQALIKDFVSGHDKLYLEGHTLSYLEKQGDISTHGGNTYISLDGGKTTIELQGVTHLKASDITTNKH
jgi:Ca2+-binding RTX toxin-like protein